MKNWKEYLQQQVSDENALIADIASAVLANYDNKADAMSALEQANGAGAYLPLDGMIYNDDLADNARKYWSEIDEALGAYYDATGEAFTVGSIGQLVWFAVEWFCHELACGLENCEETEEPEKGVTLP